jgi:DNA-binding protein Fis
LGLNIGTGAAGEVNEALEKYATSLGYENMSDFYNTLGSAQNYSSPILDMMTSFTGTKQEDGTYSGG